VSPDTYDEARNWLTCVGGTWVLGRERIRSKGAVIVTVSIGGAGQVARYGLFDDTLLGAELDRAIGSAVAAACDQLRKALG
jgi:hypothetical protein